MGKLNERIRNRRNSILALLPTECDKGKTYDEVASETEYSVATVRGDLDALKARGLVGCDDSRRPFKWYKIIKEKK